MDRIRNVEFDKFMPIFISEIFKSINYCCCGGVIEHFSYSVDNTNVYIYIYILVVHFLLF